jgi:hypothetical protein
MSGKRDAALSGAILVASLTGVFAAWTPWHSLAYGLVEVTGSERVEGRVLIAALSSSALLACYHLVMRGSLLARMIVAATGVATGAAGIYVSTMARPGSTIHEFFRTALDGTFRSGILVSFVGALTAFVLALAALHLRGDAP